MREKTVVMRENDTRDSGAELSEAKELVLT